MHAIKQKKSNLVDREGMMKRTKLKVSGGDEACGAVGSAVEIVRAASSEVGQDRQFSGLSAMLQIYYRISAPTVSFPLWFVRRFPKCGFWTCSHNLSKIRKGKVYRQ